MFSRNIKSIEVTSGVRNTIITINRVFARRMLPLGKKLDFEPFGEPFESHVQATKLLSFVRYFLKQKTQTQRINLEA